jgi:hypothetical protein
MERVKKRNCELALFPLLIDVIFKKLQRLDQGDMSVHEYYQELQKGMLRCGVVEDPEDQMVRFYGGLRREIQYIVDYKEYDSIQLLFHLSMLAKKRIEGLPTAEEQHLCATTTSSTSQSVILFGHMDVHTSLHRRHTQCRTFGITGTQQ